jgi:alpha-glucosidase
MFEALRFWLHKGVDGFRVDVMWLMIKDDQFRDNPPNPGYQLGQSSHSRLLPVYNSDRPEIHNLVAEMRAVVDEFPQRVLIGEIYLPVQQLVTYYGQDLKGANLPFNFHLLQSAWSADAVARVISDYQAALPPGACANWVLGNHDQPRIASRVGVDQARNAAMLLLTLPGTLTMYYGEELGMANVPIPPELVQDPAEKNEPGLGLGRDPERTPMPWDGSPSAGFTSGSPWLPLGADHPTVNVAALESDPHSILHLYRKLIDLRRSRHTLVSGILDSVTADDGVLGFRRGSENERILVLLNLSLERTQVAMEAGIVIASTGLNRKGENLAGNVDLEPGEGLIIDLAAVEPILASPVA